MIYRSLGTDMDKLQKYNMSTGMPSTWPDCGVRLTLLCMFICVAKPLGLQELSSVINKRSSKIRQLTEGIASSNVGTRAFSGLS